MIKIEKFIWLSEEAKEAEVYLSDGNFSLTCFSHPFDCNSETVIAQPLYTLNAKDIYKLENEQKFSAKKREGSFCHELSGKVISRDGEHHIKVGEFIIELDNPIPNDILEGSYISFICDRIDIY